MQPSHRKTTDRSTKKKRCCTKRLRIHLPTNLTHTINRVIKQKNICIHSDQPSTPRINPYLKGAYNRSAKRLLVNNQKLGRIGQLSSKYLDARTLGSFTSSANNHREVCGIRVKKTLFVH